MPVFRSPGLADLDASSSLLEAWNQRIVREFLSRSASPILTPDPKLIPNGAISMAVKWPAHPLEPMNCLDEETAEKLCDWGWAGRAELHNEYLEYSLVMRPDSSGRMRPKRLVATTELMEWWLTMALHEPEYFLDRVKGVSGTRPAMTDLFGITSQAWLQLPESVREARFKQVMVGNGRGQPPQSGLNQEFLLFMAHRINGLDDLIYVVHFGSFPYAVRTGGQRRRATMEEIFHSEDATYLFCRNADPGAAEGAYNQAFIKGSEASPRARRLAFADPLGMYIRTFSTGDLFRNGQGVPKSWTQWRRGEMNGTPQRLEFGPLDSDAAFLDEVTIGREAGAPVVTGFQLAKRLEVGPLVVIGQEETILGDAFREIPAVPSGMISCGSAADERCRQIANLKQDYDNQVNFLAGTRGGRRG